MRPVLGIDPGKNGGLCHIKGMAHRYTGMPKTYTELRDWLGKVDAPFDGTVAVMELVTGYIPRQRGGEEQGQPGSSMFNFGENYGALKMGLIAYGIPLVELIRPQKWQGFFKIPPRKKDPVTGKKESDTAHKNKILQVAIQTFKGLKLTLQVADAVMIAKYAQLVYGELTDAEADGYKVEL